MDISRHLLSEKIKRLVEEKFNMDKTVKIIFASEEHSIYLIQDVKKETINSGNLNQQDIEVVVRVLNEESKTSYFLFVD